MPIIATYGDAKQLRDALLRLGVRVKPETFSMKTSGIYIPNWLDAVPYENVKAGNTKWYFFFRFVGNHPDFNVGIAMLFAAEHGIPALAKEINQWK